MVTVSITYLVIGGVILLYLLFKLFEYKSKLRKPEVIHVDTSGVSSNPPKFIEVTQNKTINFNIGKYKICINQITIGEGTTKINAISSLFKSLSNLMDKDHKNKIDRLRLNLLKDVAYKQIVYNIYKLSLPFVKSKRGYKKYLFNYAKDNYEGIFLITEQIYDYWTYVKKLTALLAGGHTLRKIDGEAYTWNSYETDMTGNRIIKPRYGLSTN